MDEKCQYCDSKENLTQDHIIPAWVYKRSQYIFPRFVKTLGKKNMQVLCAECNQKKGGYIDMRNPIARDFWLAVLVEIEAARDRAEDFWFSKEPRY